MFLGHFFTLVTTLEGLDKFPHLKADKNFLHIFAQIWTGASFRVMRAVGLSVQTHHLIGQSQTDENQQGKAVSGRHTFSAPSLNLQLG